MPRIGFASPPPDSALWRDILKWIVSVMDDDDPDLSFTASLLHHAIERPGLTDKQAKYAVKIHTRILGLYEHEQLDCQSPMDAIERRDCLVTGDVAGNA